MIAALLANAWTAPAVAQVGLGAERYEVTITPPKRPGSEPAEASPPAAPSPSANETLGALDAPGPANSGGASASADSKAAPKPKADAGAAGSSAGAAAAAAGSAPATVGAAGGSDKAPQVARVEANLPQRTLQVGAFRQRSSAVAMRDTLAASFPNVAIVEVQSGGEVLYRINVGRLPRGSALDDLRRRLAAAGHPAFEVPAPAAPAGN